MVDVVEWEQHYDGTVTDSSQVTSEYQWKGNER
jgi:hypothetical protein